RTKTDAKETSIKLCQSGNEAYSPAHTIKPADISITVFCFFPFSITYNLFYVMLLAEEKLYVA
ncbi:MAG: hypothetical protein DRQ62_11710, partial [Gammaproteobacteria bacterium]